MFKISVWHGNLSEDYLRFVTQLGVDCLDFGQGDFFPGVKEQGYPDLDALLKIKKKVRSWGLDINRVTLPDMTERFMKGEDGGEIELENTSNVRVNSLNPGATRTGMRAAAYPADARAQGIEGFVVVRYDVSVDGRVINARVVRADPPDVFDDAALSSVRSWRFNPALVDGVPRATQDVESKVTFKLDGGDEYAVY